MEQSNTSTIGVIVDKSKATKTVINLVSAFPDNSYILRKGFKKERKYTPKKNNSFWAFLFSFFH
jgi:hypothetical protein